MQDDDAAGRAARRPTTGPSRRVAILCRVVALVLFVPAGLICLATPVLFAQKDGGGLLDDTRAYLGAGASEGVPTVSSVSCVERNTGGGSRSLRVRDWACVIDLAPVRQAPTTSPPAGMTTAEVMEESYRRLAEIRNRRGSNRLERVLASNRTGDIPTLRRLSAAGEPTRYGVVWGLGELAVRWLHATFLSVFFVVIGGGLLFLSWFVWRRTAASVRAGQGPGPR